VHRTERAGAQGQRLITRIAPVGLDAISGFSENQRGGSNETLQTFIREVPVQPEAARTGLVHEFQAAMAGKPFQQAVDSVLLGAHGAQINDWCLVDCIDTGGSDGVLIDIQTDKNSGIVHGADLRSGRWKMIEHNCRSCGSGATPTRGTNPAEVSAWPRESHTV
jgi:hypothetical protein